MSTRGTAPAGRSSCLGLPGLRASVSGLLTAVLARWRRGRGLSLMVLALPWSAVVLAGVPPAPEHAQAGATAPKDSTPLPVCSPPFYAGNVGKRRVRGRLVRRGDEVTGYYAYERWREYDAAANLYLYRPLALTGTVAADGTVTLTETDKKGRSTGTMTGVWADGTFTGRWRDPAGAVTLPVALAGTDVWSDGRDPQYRLRLTEQVVKDPSDQHICLYGAHVAFDGEPERALGDYLSVGGDFGLCFPDEADVCAGEFRFLRWTGDPPLDVVTEEHYSMHPGGESNSTTLIFAPGAAEPLLSFEAEGGRNGWRYGSQGTLTFAYEGSTLRVTRSDWYDTVGFCFSQGDEEPCAGRLQTSSEETQSYTVRRSDEGYGVEPDARDEEGNPAWKTVSSVTTLGEEQETAWELSIDDLRGSGELVHESGDTGQSVTVRCSLWGPADQAWSHAQRLAVGQVPDDAHRSGFRIETTADEASAALHWVTEAQSPGPETLLGYYDGGSRTCHSRFAAPDSRDPRPIDRGHYRTLFLPPGDENVGATGPPKSAPNEDPPTPSASALQVLTVRMSREIRWRASDSQL
jgi:hypothetical protein